MATKTPPRKQRLEARVTAEQKALFEHAAALEGRSLTDFMITALQRAAQEAVEVHEMMVLSKADQEAFINHFLNPPEPGPALRKLRDNYYRVSTEESDR